MTYWNFVLVHPVGISFSDVTDDWINCQSALSLHLTSNQPPLFELSSECPGKHVKRTILWWVVLSLEALALATVGIVEPHVRPEGHKIHVYNFYLSRNRLIEQAIHTCTYIPYSDNIYLGTLHDVYLRWQLVSSSSHCSLRHVTFFVKPPSRNM